MRPEIVARIRATYTPRDSAANGQAGGSDDRYAAFIADTVHMADQMEITDRKAIAAFLALLFVAETVPVDDASAAELNGFLDYASKALNRPRGSAAARFSLIEAWLQQRARSSDSLAGALELMTRMREDMT